MKDTRTEKLFGILQSYGRPMHNSELIEVYREKYPQDTSGYNSISQSISGLMSNGKYKYRVVKLEKGVHEALGRPTAHPEWWEDVEPEPEPEPEPAKTEGQLRELLNVAALTVKDIWDPLTTRDEASEAISKATKAGLTHRRKRFDYEPEARAILIEAFGKGYL